MSNQVNAKAGLSVKDLVTTGIFTALLFVFIMVGASFLLPTGADFFHACRECFACRTNLSADDRKST